ncbi:MAG TPA: phage tail sheath C-terminal domain-containing protein [Streptosporangiaceae bacterium]|nr:phage tail sheath C-terminal domain-containing protein [Streptosporangiaceae bacterium]
MPVTPTYPGVYIEELPSAVRTITAVTTSVTAFVGAMRRGPLGKAVTITSFADFERRFGGLDVDRPLSYAVQHFFLNGGSIAVIVRIAKGAAEAQWKAAPEDAPPLTVTALEPGTFGDGLRVAIDPGIEPDTFGLRVLDASGAELESYTGLSMDGTSPRFADSVVNPSSELISVTAQGDAVPGYSGTVSKDLLSGLPDLTGKDLVAKVDDGDAQTVTLYTADDPQPGDLTVSGLALRLERALRRASTKRGFAAARVRVFGGRLQVLSGEPGTTLGLTGEVANDLELTTARPAAFALSGGDDGSATLGVADFLGLADDGPGIDALRQVEDVNLLCLPDLAGDAFNADDRAAVLAAAEALCVEKRMFLIADSPAVWESLDDAREGLAAFDSVRSDHAALYFPHIRMTDPLTGRLRSFPPSGAVAGVIARVDAERGVWKAPAGTETRLSGVSALTVPMTDPENGLLNPLGVNCLRVFPIVGPVLWGARTLEGADALASQWKYVPVRRLALMIEESLYRGLKWVVFEPNDERLWGQIRLNVGAFMHSLFQQGAFQGTSAREAYFVKCDRDTTPQADIDRGIVNVVVGFAPLKPAEFVIVKIEQMAGRLEV